MISTIDVLRARLNGQADPQPTPVPKVKAVKPTLTAEEEHACKELKDGYRHMLREGIYQLDFKKVDGTQALMLITLDPSIIVSTGGVHVQDAEARAEASHLLRVYAVDRQGWRSFDVRNVISIGRADVVR